MLTGLGYIGEESMARRMDKVRKMVEDSIWKAYDEQRMNRQEVTQELHHLYGVTQWTQHLAEIRGLVPEIAGVIGLMHDIGRIEADLGGEKHVQQGARLAKKRLSKTGLFSETELKIIKKAIRKHNRKAEVERASYAELIKDADLLSRYYEDPTRNMSPAKWQRLHQLQQELAPVEMAGKESWNLKKLIPKWGETR